MPLANAPKPSVGTVHWRDNTPYKYLGLAEKERKGGSL